MKIAGAIFDLDGTLGNTVFVSAEAISQTALQLTRKHYTHEEIIAMFGPTEPGILRRLVPQHQWDESAKLFLEFYQSIHEQHQIGAFPGIQASLDLLAQHKVPKAIVTGKSRQSAEISLKYFKLNATFQQVKTGSIQGSAKESCIRQVLETWQVPPELVLYIGDAPSDVRIARRAGVLPVSVSWDKTANHTQLAQENPFALFQHVTEFNQWLASQLNGSSSQEGFHVP